MHKFSVNDLVWIACEDGTLIQARVEGVFVMLYTEPYYKLSISIVGVDMFSEKRLFSSLSDAKEAYLSDSSSVV